MSGTTAVPTPVFGPAGFVPPTEAAILAGVLTDLNAAFGGNLNPGLSTPQGQLASSTAAIIGGCNSTFAYFTNQVDPAFASGRMQDAIARIYFIERIPAEPTVVQCLCVGLAGVVIPAGALAQAADGTIFQCNLGGTIGAAGNVTLPFSALVAGPIACPAGSFSKPYRTVFGWDSIANVADGVIGRLAENRADFEARRSASVAINAAGSIPAIRAAVLAVPGVLDAYVTENAGNASLTTGGAVLAPHSLYVAVVGGDPQAVATAIWAKKPPGCAYNGNTTLTVLDTNAGFQPPYPAYAVTFETPAPLTVGFQVTITNNPSVPSNALALVQAAILAAFSGADGFNRARIGSVLYASRFYAGIALLGAWAEVVSIKIVVGGVASDTVNVGINQVPVTAAGNITLALA